MYDVVTTSSITRSDQTDEPTLDPSGIQLQQDQKEGNVAYGLYIYIGSTTKLFI